MREYTEDEKKIIDNIDIVDLVSQFVDLTKSGSGYKGYSPFKDENTPSFHVHPGKKIFKDFSTSIGGNVIKFYSLMKNISYFEALKELANKNNIKLSNSYNYKEIKNLLEHDILKEATDFFKSNLLKSDRAKEYLEKRKYNLNDLEKYNIGYANDSWNDLLDYLKEKYDVNQLLKLGLVSKNNDNLFDSFRDRIIFPINNIYGQIIGFGGRYIGDDTNVPKYINSVESEIFDKSSELYGLFDNGLALKKSRYAILVEGFFDVLSSHINGYDMAIASLGVSFTEKQARLLKKYIDSVVILYDNDEAGKNATKNVINILNKYEFNIRCVNMPKPYKDPDEFFKLNEKENFFEVLKSSVTAFEYLYNLELSNMNVVSSSFSKRTAIEKMRNYFIGLKNDIIYNDDIKQFSERLNLDYNILLKEYKRNNFNYNLQALKEKKEVVRLDDNDKRYVLEKTMLEYLIYSKGVNVKNIEYIKKMKYEINFFEQLNKKLDSIDYNIDKISEIILTEEEKDFLLDLICNHDENINDDKFFRLYKSLVFFELNRLNKKIRENEDIDFKLSMKIKMNIIQNKIYSSNLIEQLSEYFMEIISIKGE